MAMTFLGGMQVNFHIGDKVRLGTRAGIVTDVGTILVQVKTPEGSLRVVCPWELVRTRDR
jgi:small-conductance mechanosensitive channel